MCLTNINKNTNRVWYYKCAWTNTNTRSRSLVFRFNVSDKSAWVENVGLAAGSFYRLIFLYESFWISVNIGGNWTKFSVLSFRMRVLLSNVKGSCKTWTIKKGFLFSKFRQKAWVENVGQVSGRFYRSPFLPFGASLIFQTLKYFFC